MLHPTFAEVSMCGEGTLVHLHLPGVSAHTYQDITPDLKPEYRTSTNRTSARRRAKISGKLRLLLRSWCFASTVMGAGTPSLPRCVRRWAGPDSSGHLRHEVEVRLSGDSPKHLCLLVVGAAWYCHMHTSSVGVVPFGPTSDERDSMSGSEWA